MPERNPEALICIDFQKEYYTEGGPLFVPDGEAVRKNAQRILQAAREQGRLVVHVRHISQDPLSRTFRAGSPAVDFVPGLEPIEGEPVVTKLRPGAFYLTELGDLLMRAGIETVIICGLMSFMCCDTTAREARARGYKVLFAKDATAAVDLGDIPAATVQQVVCAIQEGFFSEVADTDRVIGLLNA